MARVNVRDKIVAAGLKVMYAQGFNGCSIQDITDTAGVPKGSFYNHFKSKELLALEVLESYQSLAQVEMLADRTKAPIARLRGYFKVLSRVHKATGYGGGCLMGNLGLELSDSSQRVRKALFRHFSDWHRAIAAVLREGQQNGEVDAGADADQMARFLIAAWEGSLLQMKVSKTAGPLDDFFRVAFVPLAPR
jgi:TetR/AcrR family transcriptional regulator, transcriptional repressor for nem operon